MTKTDRKLLARFRQHRSLSQQQLADLVGCSRSMIAQLEQGMRQPSGNLLTALGQALQLSDVELAMLFLAYDKVQQDQESMLPYIVAVLRLDHSLLPEQAEALVDLVTQEYGAAIQAGRKYGNGIQIYPISDRISRMGENDSSKNTISSTRKWKDREGSNL